MFFYNFPNISQQEQNTRMIAVREALAITRLEGKEPGRHVLAAYEQYIHGNTDWDECKQQVKSAALLDIKEYMDQLNDQLLDTL